jgi:hypothetical protein
VRFFVSRASFSVSTILIAMTFPLFVMPWTLTDDR